MNINLFKKAKQINMENKPSEKIVMARDNSIFKTATGHFEYFLKLVTQIIDTYNQLNVGKFKKEEFNSLLFNTEGFLFDKIMEGKPLEVNGLKLSKKKLFEIVEKPTLYYEILKLVQQLENKVEYYNKNNDWNLNPKQLLGFLIFADDNTLCIDQLLIDKAEEESQIYAVREKTKAVFAFAEKLSKLFNESDILHITGIDQYVRPDSIGKFILDIIHIGDPKDELSEATLKIGGIKSFDYV